MMFSLHLANKFTEWFGLPSVLKLKLIFIVMNQTFKSVVVDYVLLVADIWTAAHHSHIHEPQPAKKPSRSLCRKGFGFQRGHFYGYGVSDADLQHEGAERP
jgi:hypothetical protein